MLAQKPIAGFRITGTIRRFQTFAVSRHRIPRREARPIPGAKIVFRFGLIETMKDFIFDRALLLKTHRR